jgi:hypothetical protein
LFAREKRSGCFEPMVSGVNGEALGLALKFQVTKHCASRKYNPKQQEGSPASRPSLQTILRVQRKRHENARRDSHEKKRHKKLDGGDIRDSVHLPLDFLYGHKRFLGNLLCR